MFKKDGTKGNLLVTILVKIPENLSEQQLNICRKLRDDWMKTGKDVDKCLDIATKIAGKYGHSYISTEHMLLAIIKDKEFSRLLHKFGVQLVEMSNDL